MACLMALREQNYQAGSVEVFIVVDDGSTDHTPELVDAMVAKWAEQGSC